MRPSRHTFFIFPFLFFLIVLFTSVAEAQRKPIFMSPRLAGLGNTFVGIADDENALYTNPAGFGQLYGWNIDLLDLGLHLPEDPLTTYNLYRDVLTSASNSISNNATAEAITQARRLIGTRLDIGLGLQPLPIVNFATSRFGFAGISQTKMLSRVVDPNNPTIRAELLSDTAAYLTVGFPVNDALAIGASAKYMVRGASYDWVNGRERLELPLLTYLSQAGVTAGYYYAHGLSFDFGAMYQMDHPMRPKIGASVRNFRGSLTGEVTRITARQTGGNLSTTEAFTTSLPLMGTLGISLKPFAPLGWDFFKDVLVAADYDLYHTGVTEFGRLFHAGLEWPVGIFTIRVGLNDGYVTYGLGTNLGIFHSESASFREETGETLGLIPATTTYINGSISFVGVTDKKPKEEKKKEKAILPPTLALSLPEITRITTEESTKVRGIAQHIPNLKRVLLNSVEVPLSKEGTFEAEVALTLGKNTFRARAFNKENTAVASAEVSAARIISFQDVPETHRAYQPIVYMGTLGIMTGYPDGTFQPERELTRAELAAILVRSLGDSAPSKDVVPEITADQAAEKEVFSDVTETAWYANYVDKARDLQLIEGYPDGTFKGGAPLKRAEAVAVLSRFDSLIQRVGPSVSPGVYEYSDLSEGHWSHSHVIAGRRAGWLSYIVGTEFEPNKLFTRAEACFILLRSEKLRPRLEETFGPTFLGIKPPTL